MIKRGIIKRGIGWVLFGLATPALMMLLLVHWYFRWFVGEDLGEIIETRRFKRGARK